MQFNQEIDPFLIISPEGKVVETCARHHWEASKGFWGGRPNCHSSGTFLSNVISRTKTAAPDLLLTRPVDTESSVLPPPRGRRGHRTLKTLRNLVCKAATRSSICVSVCIRSLSGSLALPLSLSLSLSLCPSVCVCVCVCVCHNGNDGVSYMCTSGKCVL
jgi:hypothetical protein